MPAPRPRAHLLLLPAVALLAILPLLLHGASCGHDLSFHLLSWLEAATQFRHGNLHPQWAVTPAWNAGEPRFVFYPPLSWTLGALLTLLFSAHAFALVPIAFTFLALAAAGLTMHRLLRPYTNPTAALLASTFYIANPYTLFTAYERTAYGELLAAVWIPLLLAAILPSPRTTDIPPTDTSPADTPPTGTPPARLALPRLSIPSLALPLALLWLTNAPAAVMGSYTVALVFVLRLLQLRRQPRQAVTLALRATAGTLLGLGLAAFYILPAAREQRWVLIRMAIVPGMRIADNFLFGHMHPSTPDTLAHDAVLHTASLIALLLLTLAATSLAAVLAAMPHPPLSSFAKAGGPASPTHPNPVISTEGAAAAERSASPPPPHHQPPLSSFAKAGGPASPTHPNPVISTEGAAAAERPTSPTPPHLNTLLTLLATLTAALALLLTPLSAPLWRHLPELAYLQFPWRLLAILAPVAALLLGLALSPLRPRLPVAMPAALALAALLIAPAWINFHQTCDIEDTPTAQLASFHSPQGAEPTDEYTPATADNDLLAPGQPPYRLTLAPDAPVPPGARPGPAPRHLDLKLPTPETLILDLRDYPAWQVRRNGHLVPQRLDRDNGLLAIPLPAGPSHIDLTYARTPDRTLGEAISATALLLLLPLLLRRSPAASPPTPTAIISV